LPPPSARTWSFVPNPPRLRPSACSSCPLLRAGHLLRADGLVHGCCQRRAPASPSDLHSRTDVATPQTLASISRSAPSDRSGWLPSASDRSVRVARARALRCGQARGCPLRWDGARGTVAPGVRSAGEGVVVPAAPIGHRLTHVVACPCMAVYTILPTRPKRIGKSSGQCGSWGRRSRGSAPPKRRAASRWPAAGGRDRSTSDGTRASASGSAKGARSD
jgi:hypothetical protein